MITSKIIVNKKIKIKKGTIIPNLSPNNTPINHKILIPKGSIIYEGYIVRK